MHVHEDSVGCIVRVWSVYQQGKPHRRRITLKLASWSTTGTVPLSFSPLRSFLCFVFGKLIWQCIVCQCVFRSVAKFMLFIDFCLGSKGVICDRSNLNRSLSQEQNPLPESMFTYRKVAPVRFCSVTVCAWSSSSSVSVFLYSLNRKMQSVFPRPLIVLIMLCAPYSSSPKLS